MQINISYVLCAHSLQREGATLALLGQLARANVISATQLAKVRIWHIAML